MSGARGGEQGAFSCGRIVLSFCGSVSGIFKWVFGKFFGCFGLRLRAVVLSDVRGSGRHLVFGKDLVFMLMWRLS